jgi:hypothetical protein
MLGLDEDEKQLATSMAVCSYTSKNTLMDDLDADARENEGVSIPYDRFP